MPTAVQEKLATAHKSHATLSLPSQMLHYVPKGGRSRGRPPNRWRETLTGH